MTTSRLINIDSLSNAKNCYYNIFGKQNIIFSLWIIPDTWILLKNIYLLYFALNCNAESWTNITIKNAKLLGEAIK